jgi:hypothetical protein
MALPAHEKWFIDGAGGFATDWSFVVRPLTLTLVVAVVAVTVLWRLVAIRMLPTPEIRPLAFLGRLVPYVPRILAIHLGISLLAAAVTGHFLTHDLEVDGAGSEAILLGEGALGAWFITGIQLRPAALLLIIGGPLALLFTGPVGLLSAADLLGVAAFLAILPPSNATYGRVDFNPQAATRALLALRLGVGTALITLAFAEKLANPALARETLREYPALDVFAHVGIHVTPNTFVAVAGATELLFGLLVLSGAMPQVAVLVAGIPFNATLLLFGQTEMLGHLPVYGVFLTLLVYGSNPQTAQLVRWLPTRRDSIAVTREERHGQAGQPRQVASVGGSSRRP